MVTSRIFSFSSSQTSGINLFSQFFFSLFYFLIKKIDAKKYHLSLFIRSLSQLLSVVFSLHFYYYYSLALKCFPVDRIKHPSELHLLYRFIQTIQTMLLNVDEYNQTMINGTDDSSLSVPNRNSLTYYFVPFYALLFLVGTFGNGLVILTISRSPRLRTVTNTYLLNIAIADFLLLLSIPFLIVTILANGWIFGNIPCKMFYNLIHINQYISALLLAALSFDRYLAVCHPIRAIEFRTRTKCVLIIGGKVAEVQRTESPHPICISSLLANLNSFPVSDMGLCHDNLGADHILV